MGASRDYPQHVQDMPPPEMMDELRVYEIPREEGSSVVVIEQTPTGGDAVLWVAGVIVPLLVAVIGAWVGRKNAYIAAALSKRSKK